MHKEKRRWHLWVISVFMIFIYVMGIYDFIMMLTHNHVYYASHGYGEAVADYFTNYPLYFLIFWIANLVCGFAASVMLLFQIKQAAIAAFISAVSDFILIVCTAIFRNRIEVLGINVFMFDLFILAITFGLYYYIKQISSKKIK
jgi:hypothetical protein